MLQFDLEQAGEFNRGPRGPRYGNGGVLIGPKHLVNSTRRNLKTLGRLPITGHEDAAPESDGENGRAMRDRHADGERRGARSG